MIKADDVRLVYEVQRSFVPVREKHHVGGVGVFVQPSDLMIRKERRNKIAGELELGF